MPSPDAREVARAREIAAEMFRVDVQHITEAPAHCSQSETDGGCSDGATCDIVAGAEAIARFAAERHAAGVTAGPRGSRYPGHPMSMPAVRAVAFPLSLTIVCLDCQYVREIGHPCPCGSRTFIPLAMWLDRAEQ